MKNFLISLTEKQMEVIAWRYAVFEICIFIVFVVNSKCA